MKNIIIFPGKFITPLLNQLDYSEIDDLLVVLPKESDPIPNVNCIYEGDLSLTDYEINCIHPCSEAALYYLQSIDHLNPSYLRFSNQSLQCFYKMDLNTHFKNAGVSFLSKHALESTLPTHFPVVVKPNFGFASSFVEEIASQQQLESYKADVDKKYPVSLVNTFYTKYFRSKHDRKPQAIVWEDSKSDLNFFSVPFTVNNGQLESIYPVMAIGTLMSDQRKSGSVEFTYPPNPTSYHAAKMNDTCKKLISYFSLQDGVYHSEFLSNQNEVYLLEFSPRLTGGIIPMIASLSHGVNLFAKSLQPLFTTISIDENLVSGQLKLIRTYLKGSAEVENIPAPSDCLYYFERNQPESKTIEYIIRNSGE